MMRICMFFVFALVGVTAFGDIESFCGFQFGSVVQNRPGSTGEVSRCSATSCRRKMETPFRGFYEQATLTVTPKTRKIAAVRLSYSAGKRELAAKEYGKVIDVLRKKYEVEPAKGKYVTTFDLGNCEIKVTHDATKVILTATHKKLLETVIDEKEAEAKAKLKAAGDGTKAL